MFDTLGLGIRVNLDDNASDRIDPIVRDIERLERSAKNAGQSYETFGRTVGMTTDRYMRYERIREMNTALKGTDHVLTNVAKRFTYATLMAERFQRATGGMQTSVAFSAMTSHIISAQRQLSYLGYGLSGMQKSMADQRAFQAINYQLKEVQERADLTRKALKELQNSPDASKFTREIKVAQDALRAYEAQMSRMGAAQKIASANGMNLIGVGTSQVLVKPPKTIMEGATNRIMGASMLDMAVAANAVYETYDRLGKEMVGMGYTTMELRQKLTALAGSLMMIGAVATAVFTGGWLLATAALTAFSAAFEKASNVFQARTLKPNQSMDAVKGWGNEITSLWQETGAKPQDIAGSMAFANNTYGAGLTQASNMTQTGLTLRKAWGDQFTTEDVMGSAMNISKNYGVDYAQALDMITLGLKGTNGDMAAFNENLKKNGIELRNATARGTEGAEAFEKLSAALERGGVESFLKGLRALGEVAVTLYKSGIDDFIERVGKGIESLATSFNSFLQTHPNVSKLIVGLHLLAGGFLAVAAPAILLAGVGLRFKNIFSDINHTIRAMAGTGGMAVLSTQGKMASDRMRAMVVAVARMPQIFASVIPFLFLVARGFMNFGLQVAKTNPMLAVGGLALAAYANNWFGFKDDVTSAIDTVKSKFDMLKTLGQVGYLYSDEGAPKTLENLSNTDQLLAKLYGSALLVKDVYKSLVDLKPTLTIDADGYKVFANLGMEDFVVSVQNAYNSFSAFIQGFMNGLETAYNFAKKLAEDILANVQDTVNGIANFLGFENIFGKGGGGSFMGLSLGDWKSLGNYVGIAAAAFAGFKALSWFGGLVVTPFQKLRQTARNSGLAIDSLKTKLATLRSKTISVNVRQNMLGGGAMGGGKGGRGGGMSGPTGVYGVPMSVTTPTRGGYNYGMPGQYGPDGSPIQGTPPTGPAPAGGGGGPMPVMGMPMGGGFDGPDRRRVDSMGTPRQGRRPGSLPPRARLSDLFYSSFGGTEETRKRHGDQYYGDKKRRSDARTMRRYDRAAARNAAFNQKYLPYLGGDMGSERWRQGTNTRRARMQTRAGYQIAGFRDRVDNMTAGNSRQREATGRNRRGQALSPRQARTAQRMNSIAMLGTKMTTGLTARFGKAGNLAGKAFSKTMTTTARAGVTAGKVTGGVTKGIGRVGMGVGRGLVKGIGGVALKGLPFVFKMGLRAIPFLGWALMAWDIISAIFSNWDAISNGARKAWNWIKTDGVKMAKAVGTSIMNFLGKAWDWVKTKSAQALQWALAKGSAMMSALGAFISQVIGAAWDWVKDKASQAFQWALSQGSSLMSSLGSTIQSLLGAAWDYVKEYAVGRLNALIASGASVGTSIGSAIKEGIVSFVSNAVSEAGALIEGLMARIPGGGAVVKAAKGAYNTIANLIPGKSKGGIVGSPTTAIIGEAGREAIIPLSSNQRGRADNLFLETARHLGFAVQKLGAGNIAHAKPFHRESFNQHSPNVKMFANGGIVRKATPGVFGEAGPEALIPLHPSRRGRARELMDQVNKSIGSKESPSSQGGGGGGDLIIQNLNVTLTGDANQGNVAKHTEELLRALRKRFLQERRKRGNRLSWDQFVLEMNT